MYNVHIFGHAHIYTHKNIYICPQHNQVPSLLLLFPIHHQFPTSVIVNIKGKRKMEQYPISIPGKHFLKGSYLKMLSLEITADSITVVGIVRKELLV